MDEDTLICRGNSMYPTLKPLDVLYLTPYGGASVKPGDIIVFPSPLDGQLVSHRVVSVGPAGIMTRGDYNPDVDLWTLKQYDVTGQVVRLRRQRKVLRVRGGLPGRCAAMFFHGHSAAKNLAIRALFPLYDAAARSGAIARFLRLKPRVIRLARPGGVELQLILGKAVIGRKPCGAGAWLIRPPYRLLVDERSLSEGGSGCER